MKFQKWLVWGFIASLSLVGMACSNRTESRENSVTVENTNTSNTIINGLVVPRNNPIARSVVAIYDMQKRAICSGSLLPNNLVLTAAHCINPIPQAQVIVFETDFNFLFPERAYTWRPVVGVATSPTWKNQQAQLKNQGDIGLIKFNGTVPAGYVPTTLLTDSKLLKKSTPIVIAGYGIDDINVKKDSGRRTLRQAPLLMTDPDFSFLEASVDQSKGRGACFGDSGGPAYIYINGNYYVWGVVNHGYTEKKVEDRCNQLAIYTKVSVFSAWIQIAIKDWSKTDRN